MYLAPWVKDSILEFSILVFSICLYRICLCCTLEPFITFRAVLRLCSTTSPIKRVVLCCLLTFHLSRWKASGVGGVSLITRLPLPL